MDMRSLCLVGFVAMVGLYAYQRQELTPVQRGKVGAYTTSDGRHAVELTQDEINIMTDVMKRKTWSDAEYEKPINNGLINSIVGLCGSCDKETCGGRNRCDNCSSAAELVKRVLNDFRGRQVQDLFNSLGLSRNL